MPGKPNPFKTVSTAKAKESPFQKVQRERRQRGVDWSQVDNEQLHYAAAACVLAGATLVISAAMGGIGVTLRVWDGEAKSVEYASTAEELNELLEVVGDFYESSSEDLRVSLGLGKKDLANSGN